MIKRAETGKGRVSSNISKSVSLQTDRPCYAHRSDIKPAERWHESHSSSGRSVTSYQETLHTETYVGAKRHKSCNRNNTVSNSTRPYGTDTSSWHRSSHQCVAKPQKKKKKQLRNNPRSQQRAWEFTLTADWAAWHVPEQITATLQQRLYEEISFFAPNRHEKQN